MNRYIVFLSALALGCIDGSGDSDSDTAGEPEFFDGTPLVWSVSKTCASDTWTYDIITDGLAGKIEIEVTQDQSVANPADGWDELHVLDITTDDLHWDGQGSPTSATTNAEAAAMDPIGDADDDGRPDWGGAGQNFTSQTADDADTLVGSWDHWNTTQPNVATIGEVVESGADQTSLLDCTDNNGSTLSWKVAMFNDASPPVQVDCVIFGRFSAAQFSGDGCVCIDTDGDCADGDEN